MSKKVDHDMTAMREWADFKRLMEWCQSDRERYHRFLASPQEWITKLGLKLHTDAAIEAIIMQFQPTDGIKPEENVYIRQFRRILDHVHQKAQERSDENKIADDAFKQWFKRQKKRVLFECSLNRMLQGRHYIPISFELTSGCSGACSFCCLEAPRLRGTFRYQPENARLWVKILANTKKVIGAFAGSGVCYFATEPFDNPDYELFIEDFNRCFGHYPQTTTVKAVSDPKRTKRMLDQLGYQNLRYAAVRFSVVSKKQLDKIFQHFTREELACVELLLNNTESMNSYVCAGRAKRLADLKPDVNFTEAGTCICTAGFIVNLVEQTVMLAAPRRSDAEHPLGMQVYDKVRFSDAESYEDVLNTLIAKWMPLEVPLNRRLGIGSCITYKRKRNYLRIQGDQIHRTISMSQAEGDCFELIIDEGITCQEAVRKLKVSEYEEHRIIAKMQLLYDAGYLMLQ